MVYFIKMFNINSQASYWSFYNSSISDLTGLMVSDVARPIIVSDANPGLDSIMWIVKFNESATACITCASANVPWCDMY